MLTKTEVFLIKISDLLILADKKRLDQINISEFTCKNFLDVENVTNFQKVIIEKKKIDFSKINLSYVGVFDPMRGLEELLEFVIKNEAFTLDIAGGGTLNELVLQKSKITDRIKFHGIVKYEDGIELMKKSDFIIGMYYKKASNHVFAAPNKFFEALFLAKPLITTKGTLVGDKTIFYNTGYALEEGLKEITAFFIDFHLKKHTSIIDYNLKVSNASRLWNDKYSNYFNKRLVNDYINLIMTLDEKK